MPVGGIDGPKKGPTMPKKKKKGVSAYEWFALNKVKGEWIPREMGQKEPGKRIPCLYDTGSELRLAIGGRIIAFCNVFCPGDRINFMRKVTHLCDASLLA